MDLIIHTFSKDKYVINVDEYDVVMVLFIKLNELLNIDIENSKLVFSGILLNPNNTFASYGIKDGQNIFLI